MNNLTKVQEKVLESLQKSLLCFDEARYRFCDDERFYFEVFSLPKYKSRKMVYLDLITDAGFDLFCTSEMLNDDKELILCAVGDLSWSLQCASSRLKDDKEVVLAAVIKNSLSLKYASSRLKDDKDIVLAAVSSFGRSLRFASDRLCDDKWVVLAAINQKPKALKFSSKKLRDDKEVISKAVMRSPPSFKFASKRLKCDLDFLKELFQGCPIKILANCHSSAKKNPHIYLPAFRYNCSFAVNAFSLDALLKIDLSPLQAITKQRIYLNFEARSKTKDIFVLANAKKKILFN